MNSVLHTNTKVSTAGESYCERKTAKFGRGPFIATHNFEFRGLKYCVFMILFSIVMLILLHYFE
jgi:hypothetical protein